MSVRKRTWRTRRGEQKESWIVDYVDQHGERHIQTFERKKDADDYHATVRVDVSKGIHTPQSQSLTIAQAAEDWIRYVESASALPSSTTATISTTTSARASAARSWQS
ncbi:MAG TPA: hypothetical protein VL198_02945 [Pseudolabrys sp.]|jgi:hypothetical protein|nr:hypothetical protein [Pseudolabrys sp.]